MTIDETLLRRATEARDHAEEIQQEAFRSRLAFHETVCELHRAGGSLREIAEALNLSHQRVHQIVGGSSASGVWARLWRRPGSAAWPQTPASCSFCGVHQFKTRKLIAGPGTWICEGCITLARRVLEVGGAEANERAQLKPADADGRCHFCGHGVQRNRRRLVTGGGTNICASCLKLCDEILAEDRERGR
jgi:ClpX C4-type zinc finger